MISAFALSGSDWRTYSELIPELAYHISKPQIRDERQSAPPTKEWHPSSVVFSHEEEPIVTTLLQFTIVCLTFPNIFFHLHIIKMETLRILCKPFDFRVVSSKLCHFAVLVFTSGRDTFPQQFPLQHVGNGLLPWMGTLEEFLISLACTFYKGGETWRTACSTGKRTLDFLLHKPTLQLQGTKFLFK